MAHQRNRSVAAGDGSVRVVGCDIYDLDRNGDGVACDD
jgi:hypothetical protein